MNTINPMLFILLYKIMIQSEWHRPEDQNIEIKNLKNTDHKKLTEINDERK